MLNLKDDIQPLTTFRNNSVKMLKQLHKTGRPIVLTVNGKSEAVVQSAEAYQRLLDIAALADPREGIRQGLAEMSRGEGQPANEFLEEMREKYGIRR